MTFFQKGISSLRTVVLGHLSALEGQAVHIALHIVKESWPGYEPHKTTNHPPSEEKLARVEKFIAELESNDPKRQRALLASAEFQAWLANERARKSAINSLHYFQSLDGEKPFTLRTAVAAQRKDLKSYPDYGFFVNKLEPGQESFLPLRDDLVLWEAALFGWVVLDSISATVLIDKALIADDDGLREKILETYAVILSKVPDESLDERLKNMEVMACETQPKRFALYQDVFRKEGWKDRFIEAQREEQARKLAERLDYERFASIEAERVARRQRDEAAQKQLERERAARQQREEAAQKREEAAQKRKLLEEQLTFVVEDGVLDISTHGWPGLPELEDQMALFQNLKAAFARSTKVRFAYLPRPGMQILIARGIRSMSARQLSCVKHQLWADRIGVLESEKYLGYPTMAAARLMMALLNADGRASVYNRNREHEEFERMLPEVAASLKADVDGVWLMHADTFQKWITSETFAGELTRWIVEDPADSAGWATSR